MMIGKQYNSEKQMCPQGSAGYWCVWI